MNMRFAFFFIPFILVLFIRCEKEYRAATNELTDGFCIQINDDHFINHNDIEYYDFSTHIVYLKSSDTSINKPEERISFTVYADFELIYQGAALPLYSCAMIAGPTINYFYPDFVISIGNNVMLDPTVIEPPDPREDGRIITALSKYNQLHPGLKVMIDSIMPAQTGLRIKISVTNEDSFDYYILSPDNMGMDLFHYFTNGLFITDDNRHEFYRHHIETLQPDPYDSWNKEWFYLLRSKEKKTFTLLYNQFDIIPKGQYIAYFRFPGLRYQVKNKEDLADEYGRIWLGEVDVNKSVSFN